MTDEQKEELDEYISNLESQGHDVHSYKKVNQNDDTGYSIVMGHYIGMKDADEIHVFWDVDSKGSHFDLGMALVFSELLDKKIQLIKCYKDDEGKSYWKAMSIYTQIKNLPRVYGGCSLTGKAHPKNSGGCE